jgi:hypothetical protein
MKNVFTWQDAVLDAALPAATKLVLLTLSTYMNGRGNTSAWPSQKTLAADTSLSKRSIITHIETAVAAGFLVKKKRAAEGSLWDANEYFPTFPDGVKLLHPTDAVRGEAAAPAGVNQLHLNNPLEQPIKKEPKGSTKQQAGEFEMFWSQFPKQRAGSKDKARAAYWSAVSRGGSTAILAGVIAYANSDEVQRGYAKGAAAWLNDDRWTVNYRQGPGKPQTTAAGVPILEGRDVGAML